jgi:hypothetical protein
LPSVSLRRMRAAVPLFAFILAATVAHAAMGQLQVSTTSINFGVVSGGTKTATLKLTNGGTSYITISQVQIAGAGFIEKLAAPVSISGGNSLYLNVTFAPTSAGIYSSSMTIASNALNPSITVLLSGQSGTASTTTTTLAVCGTRTGDSACGNVGDPYQGGASDPLALAITQCGQTLQHATSYKVAQNLTAATPGSICLDIPGPHTTVDLGGFTITGRIRAVTDVNGLTLFHGTVRCSFLDTSADFACVRFNGGEAFTTPVNIHHLTVENTAASTASSGAVRNLLVDWSGANSGTVYGIRIFNVSSQLRQSNQNLSRTANLQTTSGVKAEFFNDSVLCDHLEVSCQGILAYGSQGARIHNNLAITPPNDAIGSNNGDTARAFMLDTGANGQIDNNKCAATNNNRCIRCATSKARSLWITTWCLASVNWVRIRTRIWQCIWLTEAQASPQIGAFTTTHSSSMG